MTVIPGARRAICTSKNLDWEYAENPLDLIPITYDTTGAGDEMVHLVGQFLVTQGDAAGRRFEDVMTEWQGEFVRYLFGEVDRRGKRKVRRAFLKIAKGNGKTVLVAAIALAWIIRSAMRGENTRSLVAIIAASISSADICFRHIEEAVLNDPHLEGMFRSSSQRRSIKHVESGIECQVLPPRRDAVVGRRPSLAICDELHEASMDPHFGEVWDQLVKGGANWPDFLTLQISTSPIRVAQGAYATTLQAARRIRDGDVNNDSFLPVLYEWPTEREKAGEISPKDVDEWWRSMPCLDVTLPRESIVQEFEDARDSPSTQDLRLFFSQRLGIEPADQVGTSGLVLQDKWDSLPHCPNPSAGAPVYIAFDPSSGTDDPFAVCVAWEEGALTCVRSEQHLLRSAYKSATPGLRDIYDQSIAGGELFLHNSAELLDAAVLLSAEKLQQHSGYAAVMGGDAWGRAGFVAVVVEKFGIEYQTVKQGWTLAAALADAEALAHDGRLAHSHAPLQTFNVKNLRVEDSPQGRRFSKLDAGASGQGQAKIDGAMALLSALFLVAQHRAEQFDAACLIG